MKKVVILAAENCVLSTIASPMDMFLQVGVLWNVTMGKIPDRIFEVKIVTSDGQAVMALKAQDPFNRRPRIADDNHHHRGGAMIARWPNNTPAML